MPVLARLAAVVVVALGLALPLPAGAALGSGSAGGRLIAPGRAAPQAVADGAGGVIVSSRDLSTGAAVLNRYAPAGVALWDLGLAFPDAAGVQLVSDGAGGAIVAVEDPDEASMTVGRIRASGATTWQVRSPLGLLASGGDGGAWILYQSAGLWADGIAADGSIRPRTQIAGSADAAAMPAAVGDEAGGVWIAWRAAAAGGHFAIRLQHLSGAGTLWEQPAEVAGSSEAAITPALALDGRGGVLVSWRASGHLWVHDVYEAGGQGRFRWDRVFLVAIGSAAPVAVAADGLGGVFVASTVRLRDEPLPLDLLTVSFLGPDGAMRWSRSVASVEGGVLDLEAAATPGAMTLGWQEAGLPQAGRVFDTDLYLWRVASDGSTSYAEHEQPLATSLGPESFGSLADGGAGSVVAVFTQAPCLRPETAGVAMQRISADGARAFPADGGCPQPGHPGSLSQTPR